MLRNYTKTLQRMTLNAAAEVFEPIVTLLVAPNQYMCDDSDGANEDKSNC
jgi:hypothetical protein